MREKNKIKYVQNIIFPIDSNLKKSTKLTYDHYNLKLPYKQILTLFLFLEIRCSSRKRKRMAAEAIGQAS
jgi:hypothetical protein